MSDSAVSICSNALLLVGDRTISSLDEDNDRARIVSNLYPQVRRAVLRSHPWNCAIKRVQLAPDAQAPAFDFDYQYSLPADWLRTLQVGETGCQIDYAAEGRKLLASDNPLPLVYVYNNETEATYDSSLVHALTTAMAAAIAYPITKSASLRDSLQSEFLSMLQRARNIDGQDNPPDTLGNSMLRAARYG